MLLEVITGKDAGRQVTVPEAGVVVGRSPDCDVTLDDSTVSRKHCRIALESGEWVVQDLGSRSGVIVNETKGGKQSLTQGAVLQLGDLRLRVAAICSSGTAGTSDHNLIRFRCRCGKEYAVKAALAGKTAVCKQCGDKLIVPIMTASNRDSCRSNAPEASTPSTEWKRSPQAAAAPSVPETTEVTRETVGGLWFYAAGDQQIGPVSETAIKLKAEAGEINAESLVWKEGMNAWVPARQTTLREYFHPGTPPPLPQPPSSLGPPPGEMAPSESPQVPPMPPPREIQAPSSRSGTRTRWILVGIATFLLVVGGAVLYLMRNRQTTKTSARVEETVFSLDEGKALLASLETLPKDPEAFAQAAKVKLLPLRQRCQQAIEARDARVRKDSEILLQRVQEIERERPKVVISGGGHEAEIRVTDDRRDARVLELERKIQDLQKGQEQFCKHVREEYEAIYQPFARRYSILRKQLADIPIAWRFDADNIRGYFLRDAFLFIHCAPPNTEDERNERLRKLDTIHVLDAETGKERGIIEIGADSPAGLAVTVNDVAIIGNIAYIVSNGKCLNAFELSSVRHLWDFAIPEECQEKSGAMAIVNLAGRPALISYTRVKNILVGEYTRSSFCLPSLDGQFAELKGVGPVELLPSGILVCGIWSEEPTGRRESKWTIMDSKNCQVLYDASLLSRDLAAAIQQAHARHAPATPTSPGYGRTVAYNAEWVVFQRGSWYCSAFNWKTKKFLDLFDCGLTPGQSCAFLLDPQWIPGTNMVLYATQKDGLAACDLARGCQLWRSSEGSSAKELWPAVRGGSPVPPQYGSPEESRRHTRLCVSGNIFLWPETGQTYSRGLYAFDIGNGKQVWFKRFDMQSCQVAATEDRFLVLRDSKNLSVVDPTSGNVLWTRIFPKEITMGVKEERDGKTRLQVVRREGVFGGEEIGAVTGKTLWLIDPQQGFANCVDIISGRETFSERISPLVIHVRWGLGTQQNPSFGTGWSAVGSMFGIAGFKACPSYFDLYDVQQTSRLVDLSTGKDLWLYQHYEDLRSSASQEGVTSQGRPTGQPADLPPPTPLYNDGRLAFPVNSPSHWDQYPDKEATDSGGEAEAVRVEDIQFRDFRVTSNGILICRNNKSVKAFNVHLPASLVSGSSCDSSTPRTPTFQPPDIASGFSSADTSEPAGQQATSTEPAGVGPSRKPATAPGVPPSPREKAAASPRAQGSVQEGIGWRDATVGATREEVRRIFGQPENSDPNWLVYHKRFALDFLFPAQGEGATEVRFNPGFSEKLSSGIGIGSSLQQVTATYGLPSRTLHVSNIGEVRYASHVLYLLPTACEISYQDKGVTFWFDKNNAVSQFVVFRPY
jgi:hypothetical protein